MIKSKQEKCRKKAMKNKNKIKTIALMKKTFAEFMNVKMNKMNEIVVFKAFP